MGKRLKFVYPLNGVVQDPDQLSFIQDLKPTKRKVRKPYGMRNTERAFHMAALYQGGETMEIISLRYKVSRERVRQILEKVGIDTAGLTRLSLSKLGRVHARIDNYDPTPRVQMCREEGLSPHTVERFWLAAGMRDEIRDKCRRNYVYHRVMDLIADYKRKAEEVGRTPVAMEIAFGNYITWFGGTGEVARLLGYTQRFTGQQRDPLHIWKINRTRRTKTAEEVYDHVMTIMEMYREAATKAGRPLRLHEIGTFYYDISVWFKTLTDLNLLLGYETTHAGRKGKGKRHRKSRRRATFGLAMPAPLYAGTGVGTGVQAGRGVRLPHTRTAQGDPDSIHDGRDRSQGFGGSE